MQGVIFEQGKHSTELYGIIDGEVEIELDAVKLGILGVDSIFGEQQFLSAVLGDLPGSSEITTIDALQRTRTARTVVDCQLAVLPQRRFIKLCKEVPSITDHFAAFTNRSSYVGPTVARTTIHSTTAIGRHPEQSTTDGNVADSTKPSAMHDLIVQVLHKLDEQGGQIAAIERKVEALTSGPKMRRPRFSMEMVEANETHSDEGNIKPSPEQS